MSTAAPAAAAPTAAVDDSGAIAVAGAGVEVAVDTVGERNAAGLVMGNKAFDEGGSTPIAPAADTGDCCGAVFNDVDDDAAPAEDAIAAIEASTRMLLEVASLPGSNLACSALEAAADGDAEGDANGAGSAPDAAGAAPTTVALLPLPSPDAVGRAMNVLLSPTPAFTGTTADRNECPPLSTTMNTPRQTGSSARIVPGTVLQNGMAIEERRAGTRER